MDCTQDCQRRRVGCRTDCPDWAEHERLKAERYAATARKYAAQPSEALKEPAEEAPQGPEKVNQ